MNNNQLGKGLASLGIAAAVIYGIYITKNITCLWALLFILFLW